MHCLLRSVAGVAGAFALAGALACGSERPTPPALMQGWGGVVDPLDGGGVLTYALTVAPAQWEALLANPLQTQWAQADLEVSGKAMGRVGLRFQGTAARLKACFKNGKQVCPKVSMSVRFDLDRPQQRFFGLAQLHFHSMPTDPSGLRERLAAELFRRMDVESARTAHGFVSVNGQAKGLFALLEHVDGNFTQARWPDEGDGNLYKEVWPNHSSVAEYSLGLETNKQTADHTVMASFAAKLQAAKPAELTTVVGDFLDIDQVMRYLAVDRAINNYDGVTSLYCGVPGQACSSHSYLWYQNPLHNRFVWIPAELGEAFTVRTPFDRMPEWTVKPANCEPQVISDEVGLVLPPGCDPVFEGLAGARPAYQQALDQLLARWDVDQLLGLLDHWAAEIAPAVAHDSFGPSPVVWRAAVDALKTMLWPLRDRLLALRQGQQPAPFGLASPGLTDFDDISDLAFHRSASTEANPGSGAVLGLTDTGALAGGQDVRFDFEFGNGTTMDLDADAPLAQMRLPFLASPAGLQGLQQIQLQLAADHVRTLRIEVDSPKYGDDPDFPDRYGWVVAVSQLSRPFTLDVAKLGLPPDALGAKVSIAKVLGSASGLIFRPQPRGLDANGFLPTGRTDRGYLRVDGITIQTRAPAPPGPNPKSLALFDEAAILDFHLSFPDNEWDKLLTLTGPADKRWVACGFQALHLPPVAAACRRKGDREDWALEKSPQILVRFNQSDKQGRYLGLRRLNLESFAGTAAPIRDRLGMWLMRAAGLDAPRVNHVRVFKDGVLLGLYQNIEVLDREFLEDHFRFDAAGNLWEGGEQLKTNESVLASVTSSSRLAHLRGLVAAEPLRGEHGEFFAKVPQLLDVDQILRLMAAETALVTLDNFSNGGPNFAYYEHPKHGFMVLPWDLDRIFTVGPSDASPSDYRGLSGTPNKLRLLLNQNPVWKAAFDQHLIEIRDQLLARMPGLVDTICAQIAPVVMADPNRGSDFAAFEADCAEVKRQIRARIVALKALLGL